MHVHFSLCMITQQSFHFADQIVRLLWSLQNVLEMTPLVLQAHLQTAREIVSDITVVLRKFWGHLKNLVYENNPQTIGDLKTAFTARIRAIPIEECVRVIDNFVRRLQVCLQPQEDHLEHILEKT